MSPRPVAAAGDPTGGVGRPVGGDGAQRAARRELSRPEYHHHGPGPLQRFTHWVGRQLDRLLDAGGSGGHALLLVGVLALVVVLVLAARSGLSGVRPRRRTDLPGDPLAGVDAREHRRLAAGYETDGRWAEALREWLRAAVATIEERGVLPVRPGRTGARTAAEAGPLLPAAAADLATSTAAFDEVWFGGRTATATDAAAAHRAADAVRAVRARTDSPGTTPTGIAAPW